MRPAAWGQNAAGPPEGPGVVAGQRGLHAGRSVSRAEATQWGPHNLPGCGVHEAWEMEQAEVCVQLCCLPFAPNHKVDCVPGSDNDVSDESRPVGGSRER